MGKPSGSHLISLPAFKPDSPELMVIIDTPKGSRNKFKYDEQYGIFTLRRVLPVGMVFPYDFGFIPSTRGGDGDPLDVLLLMDEPAFPGCLIPARLIGGIEATQTQNGKTDRNDRLIAIATASRIHDDIQTLADLNQALVEEIEHFFISYNEPDGKRFEPVGRYGPERARQLVRESGTGRAARKNKGLTGKISQRTKPAR